MDNYAIADQLSLLSKLMDIHGDNSFKAKSYAQAAFALEKLEDPIAQMPRAHIARIRSVGDSVAKKIAELLDKGVMSQLQELIKNTPEGVLEMLNIKGLGPKKINILWKGLGIETIEALMTACEQNVVAAQKGFGEKTQEKILESIAFQQSAKGKYHYATIEAFAEAFTPKLEAQFPNDRFALTGAFRRQMDIIETLDWVTTASSEALQAFLLNEETVLVTDRDGMLVVNVGNTLLLRFYTTTFEAFGSTLFLTTGSDAFVSAQTKASSLPPLSEEAAVFEKLGKSFVPPYLRESSEAWNKPAPDDLVDLPSIKGLIHAHSNWSDGTNTLEEMAEALIAGGYEYLVISDHSKAAYYAGGLDEQRIAAQHRLIDELNLRYAPFKIFKSIECDILGDGQLDYDDAVLRSFDLVIASVHSNLDMTEEKAMLRLMGAIENKHTTIMGHLTGRLLLRRKGYAIDHKAIIDACAQNKVAIEINAHPKRLDMDWRWVEYAQAQGVLLSINPDAHAVDQFHNNKYGVLVAQKGRLQKRNNLSSFSLAEFEAYLKRVRMEKGV